MMAEPCGRLRAGWVETALCSQAVRIMLIMLFAADSGGYIQNFKCHLLSVYDIIFEKNLGMSRKKIQSLHELVKDKTIQIIYDKINSVYLSEYKQKIWNDFEHYYSLVLHYANEREDQKIFYGRIILQENNSVFQMTLDDYCFLTHFISISALI